MIDHNSRLNGFLLLLSTSILLAWAGLAGAAGEQWVPPGVGSGDTDWLKLNDGSWITGRMKQLDEGDLYFDTDDLSDLKLDMGDVEEFVSPNVNTYRFEGRRVVTGTGAMKGGTIVIDDGAQIHSFPRSELVNLIEGTPTERNLWSAQASLGFTGRSGNTDQTDLNATIDIMRRSALTRFLTNYRGNYGSSSGAETANNHRVSSSFDVYLTRHLFLTVPGFELYHDPFSNIDWRITPAVGIGYDVFANSWLSWEVGGGVGYQWTRFTSAPVGDDIESNDAAIIFSTRLEVDITNKIDWDTDYKIQVVATDIDQTSQHLGTVISFEVWGPLDLDVGFYWDNIIKPRLDAAGNRPESNDYRFTVGLGLDFF